MASNPPISFDAKAKTAANPASGGYPYQLKGADLDKNFTFATENFDEDDFNVTTGLGAGGHQSRKVALARRIPELPGGDDPLQLTATGDELSWQSVIPEPPTSGTHVLGAVSGVLAWIATEEC